MNEMVERVAKALYEQWANYPACAASKSWEDRRKELPGSAEDFRRKARVCIEAMRTPTPSMLRAACKSMSPDKRPTQKRVGVKAKHGIRYRAMIDSALAHSAENSADNLRKKEG